MIQKNVEHSPAQLLRTARLAISSVALISPGAGGCRKRRSNDGSEMGFWCQFGSINVCSAIDLRIFWRSNGHSLAEICLVGANPFRGKARLFRGSDSLSGVKGYSDGHRRAANEQRAEPQSRGEQPFCGGKMLFRENYPTPSIAGLSAFEVSCALQK